MENLLYKDSGEFTDLTKDEQENLRIVMEELKGWDSANLEQVISVMDKDIVYHDITLPAAKGHDGLRAFGEGWLKAAPNFTIFIEKFIVQGNCVVNVGRISGTITGEYFGLQATNKNFDCMFCQVAILENGKIKYIRDHWDSNTMAQQVGWGK